MTTVAIVLLSCVIVSSVAAAFAKYSTTCQMFSLPALADGVGLVMPTPTHSYEIPVVKGQSCANDVGLTEAMHVQDE